MKKFNKFKGIVEPKYVLISTVVTLISATMYSISNEYNKLHKLTVVAFFFFCISISTVLIQILLSVCICNETLEEMKVSNSGIIAPPCADQTQSELTSLLNDYSEDIEEILIICYGTSGYNDTISQVYNGVIKRKIMFKIMVCGPNAVFQNSKSDKKKITKLVEEVSSSSDFKFYYSKFLPTIRGCIVYNKKKEPIWNCLQTYFYSESVSFPSAQYELSYAIVGRKENTYILKANSKIIEGEFKRLKSNIKPVTNNRKKDKYEYTK